MNVKILFHNFKLRLHVLLHVFRCAHFSKQSMVRLRKESLNQKFLGKDDFPMMISITASLSGKWKSLRVDLFTYILADPSLKVWKASLEEKQKKLNDFLPSPNIEVAEKAGSVYQDFCDMLLEWLLMFPKLFTII